MKKFHPGKKIISAMLVLAMLLSLCAPALGADAEGEGEPDTTPPSSVVNLTFDAASAAGGMTALSWEASTDEGDGVDHYAIYRSDVIGFDCNEETLVGSVAGTSFTETPEISTRYWYRVVAVDKAGNRGAASEVCLNLSYDGEAPNKVTDLQAGAAMLGKGVVELSWTAPKDNVGVVSYNVYRSASADFASGKDNLMTTTAEPAFSEIADAGTYYYRVIARDAYGNSSEASDALKVEVTGTLPEDVVSTPDVNHALSKTVVVDGQVSDKEGGPKAVDGDGKTKWCVRVNDGTTPEGTHRLEIDLGKDTLLDHWVVKHAQAGGEGSGYNTRDFKLQYLSGDTWVDADAVVDNTAGATSRSFPAIIASKVRLEISKAEQGDGLATVRVYEVELYSPSAASIYEGSLMLHDGVTVAQSGFANENEMGKFACDGDETTKWSAQYNRDVDMGVQPPEDAAFPNGVHWMSVDLGAVCTVNKMMYLGSASEQAVYRTQEMYLQTSEDGKTWKYEDQGTWKDNSESGYQVPDRLTQDFTTPITSRYFRLVLPLIQPNNTNYNPRVREFHLFGAPKSEAAENPVTAAPTDGATVTLSKPNAKQGESVNVQVAYNREDRKFVKLLVTGWSGTPVQVTQDGTDMKFSFTMPNEPVTVKLYSEVVVDLDMEAVQAALFAVKEGEVKKYTDLTELAAVQLHVQIALEDTPNAAGVTAVVTKSNTGTDQYDVVLSKNGASKTKTIAVTFTDSAPSKVVSVAAVADMTVPYGLDQAKIPLPKRLEITLEGGEKKDISVNWACAAYDGDVDAATEYNFVGTLSDRADYTNPDGVKAACKVTVNPIQRVWDFTDSAWLEGIKVPGRTDETVTMVNKVTGGHLEVSGTHSGSEPAQIYNTLYSNLKIPVTENTRLSYHIKPQQPGGANGGYDYSCYSMHVSIDLLFDDDTYMSDLNVEDQNAIKMDPDSQGVGKGMVYAQDNLITVNVGEYAGLVGKTISAILVGYANKTDLRTDLSYKTEIDDLRIEDVSPEYETLADYVTILRGTNTYSGIGGGTSRDISRGLTGPMMAVPHGYNFWAPENGTGDDMFIYSRGYITNIRLSHQPSVWVGERGRWTFMVDGGGNGNSYYDQETFVTKAHYVSADFISGKAAGVKLEMSPTDHGVAARFTYASDSTKRNIVFGNLNNFTAAVGEKSFTATVSSGSYGLPGSFVYGEFDRPISAVSGSTLSFAAAEEGTTVVNMKLATSFISADQAKSNFDQELANKDFDTIMAAAKKLWNDKLGIIEIEGASEEQMITFYSSMYRLFLYPNNMGEYTGQGTEDGWQYRSPYDNSKVSDGKLYYNNGFWDTYRTTWAAYSLLTPEMNSEMLNGLLQHFEDSDWIPRWIAPGGTPSMVGTSSDVVFGDAYLRGAELTDAQWKTAYKAALKNASMSSGGSADGGRSGLDTGIFLGYTPGTGSEMMSWAMEGYINDAGIANLAKALGDEDGYEYYLSRATNYVNLFDPTPYQTYTGGWFKGKDSTGKFAGNFNPISWGNAYTETNGWNMAFTVPQDGQGLVNLYGSRENLAEKLDEFFDPSNCNYIAGGYSGVIHEMREAQEVKLGQYGHSNQPSHHIPYMYLYAGRPDRTQEVVRSVLRQCYVGGQIGQGYLGDEDNGEMSGWYIFSALGMYPVDMGSGELAFGSPLFTKATIHHENGHDLVISAPENSRDNIYVNGLTINDVPYKKTSILQTDLTDRLKTENVTLEFAMQSAPGTWGTEPEAAPVSITKGTEIADPLRDKTVGETTVLEAAPNFTAGVAAASAYSAGATNLKNAFDNNSKNSATLTPVEGKASVYYCFPEPTAVSLYTLTSGANKDKAPSDFALYGSDDGESWTELDSRTGVSFDWKTYTKPFLTQTPDFLQFKYFRMDILSDTAIELGELELMSRTQPDLDEKFLTDLIAQAEESKTGLTEGNYTRLATLLGEAITAAKAVDDTDASAVAAACAALGEAIADATGLTGLWTELDAAKTAAETTMPDAVSEPLAAAIAAAETATESGTFAGMKTARTGLRTAMVGVTICTDLDAKLAEAATAKGNLEQEALKNLLQETINAAQAVRGEKTSTRAKLTAAMADLEDAMQTIPGLAELWPLLAEAKTIETDGKAEVLVKALNAAITKAENATTGTPTLEELQAAFAELERAMFNIKLENLRTNYEQIIAISAEANKGLSVDSGNPGNWGGVNPDEWARYDGLVFDGRGAVKVRVNYAQASDAAGSLAIYIDSLDSEPVCVMKLADTGDSWQGYTDVTGVFNRPVTGVHSVYLYTIGGQRNGQTMPYVANIKYLQFYEGAEDYALTVANGVIADGPDTTARYKMGDNVSVTANSSSDPTKEFKSWTAPYLTGVDLTQNPLKFAMPPSDMTITATYGNTPDQDAVEAAQKLVKRGRFIVPQAVANTDAAVKTWLLGAINALEGMEDTGITVAEGDVVLAPIVPAVADAVGTEGTDGSFTFTITLKKGVSTVTETELTGVITRTPVMYDVTPDLAIENGRVTVDPARAAEGTEVTVTAEPDAGYVLDTMSYSKADGTGESTVITDGKFTMPAYDVTVTATFKETTDRTDLEVAKNLIENRTYTVPQATANNEAAVKTWLAAQINALADMSDTGVVVAENDITVTNFVAAVAETAGNKGSHGNFTFTAALTKGGSSVTTVAKTGVITKTPYAPPVLENHDVTVTVPGGNGTVTANPTSAKSGAEITLTIAPADGYELAAISAGETLSGEGNTRTFTMPDHDVTVTASFKKTADQLAVEAAKKAIEKETYIVAQADANDEESVKTWLTSKLATLTGVDAEVVVTAFHEATEGDSAKPNGANGNFTFNVTLTKGKSSIDTEGLVGTITATAYVAPDQTTPPAFEEYTAAFADAEALAVTFTLKGEAVDTYKVYAAVTEGDELSDPEVEVSENTLTLTFTAQPDEDTTYYISATEGELTESPRTVVIVKPYVAPPELDTAPIDEAFAAAESAKTGISIKNADPADVDKGVKFVSTEVMAELDAAMVAAKAAAENAKTQDEIQTAADTLNAAVKTFKAAIQTGTYTKPYNPPSGGSSSNTTTKTEKNEDGSTTKTVTNSKTGDVTATTTYPDGTKIVATTPKDGETTIEVTVPKDKESVIVTIPTAAEPKPGEVAVIVHEDGTKEILKASIATEAGMKVLLDESCKLEIMDNSKTFADVGADHWAADAVQFVASRELFNGGDGGFLPAGEMSRGMLFTVLARLDGQETEGGETWYSAAMDWAKETGISDGTNAESSITREQLAAMLYRYAGSPEVKDASMEAFDDAANVSDWATDAMLWCVNSGILQGSDNKLNPNGTATRAEVAVMLQRFIGTMAQ